MVPADPAYQFSPFAIAPALTAAVMLLFAIRILLIGFSRTSLALLGISVAAAAWQGAFALMYLAADPRMALIWARAGCACAALMAPAAYQFVVSILPLSRQRRIISSLAWLVAAQFAILILATDYIVTGVGRFWWGFYPAYDAAARVLYLVFLAGLLTAVVVEIVRGYPSSRGIERRRLRLFAIALVIGCLAAVDFLAVYGIAVYPFGWAALLGSAAVAMYTVTKHGLVPITPSLAANEIISTMRDLLLVSDRDGRILFVNNAAVGFLGYGREEIIGRQLEELFVPSDDSEATALQGRWIRDREYVFRTKVGQPIELTLSHSPVTQKGEITGAVIIGRDLRERKRYEWEARRAVALLESTLDSTADGILVIGQEGRILTWNQRFADMWGLSAELMERDEDHDLIGHLVAQLVDPAEFLRSLEALQTDPEVESVHLLECKDGRRLEQYSISRYLDDSPLRVWSFRDVTARLAAEEALRDSEARYRLLFEQNAAGVCLATISGRIIDCNATFTEMVGYTVEELTRRELGDVLESAAAEEIRSHLEETPTLRGLEIELQRQDGERVSAVANISLLGRGERALLHMTAVDISDRKRAEEQIEYQAYHDALTQLPNRRLFVERLEMSLLVAKRARENVAVLFIDLDRFKSINDTLGHSVADALLVEIAQRLRTCVRQTDTVARYGGDEFTIILPDLQQPEDAVRVAEKILERVVEPVRTGTTAIEISVSIGIAVSPFDGTDFDTLLRNADDAMYRAKKAGRNNYQLCTEQMKTRAMERLSMQSRLRKAMSDEELIVVYQPLVSIATRRLAGAEATVRWNDPERGVVEADDLLAIAEDTGLILPLSEWALFTACRQLRWWSESGLPPLRMSVNISTRQFQQRDLAGVVRRAIDNAGIDPQFLELEIPEATAMRDVEATIEALEHLRNLGVSIAIDHFGNAYSPLGYLQVLPIHAVKIDRRLLQRVATVPADAAIVGAIIHVGRTLNLRVGIEGVQTAEEAEFLERRGCDEAQGPYFSPPVDFEKLSELMVSAKPL